LCASLQVLVGNKSDMDESKRAVPYSRGQALADEFRMRFFETSAKANTNVDDVFQARTLAASCCGAMPGVAMETTALCLQTGVMVLPCTLRAAGNVVFAMAAVGGEGYHGAAQGFATRCQQQRRRRAQPAGRGGAAESGSQQQERVLLTTGRRGHAGWFSA
jgi:hypothetical protein